MHTNEVPAPVFQWQAFFLYIKTNFVSVHTRHKYDIKKCAEMGINMKTTNTNKHNSGRQPFFMALASFSVVQLSYV